MELSIAQTGAIEIKIDLLPIGGVFSPAVYAGPQNRDNTGKRAYAEHEAIIGGEKVACVHIDNPASQANRAEEIIWAAIQTGELPIGHRVFRDGVMAGQSNWTLPHRDVDGVIRNAQYEGQSWLKSDCYKTIELASMHSPDALWQQGAVNIALYGVENRMNGKGQPRMSVGRSVVGRITGINVTKQPVHGGGMLRSVEIDKDIKVKLDERNVITDTGKGKTASASNAMVGTVPPRLVSDGLACFTAERIEAVYAIDIARLRSMRWQDPAIADALVALALYGIVAQYETGVVSLRSNCTLAVNSIQAHQFGSGGKAIIELPASAQLRDYFLSAAERVSLPLSSKVWVLEPTKPANDMYQNAVLNAGAEDE